MYFKKFCRKLPQYTDCGNFSACFIGGFCFRNAQFIFFSRKIQIQNCGVYIFIVRGFVKTSFRIHKLRFCSVDCFGIILDFFRLKIQLYFIKNFHNASPFLVTVFPNIRKYYCFFSIIFKFCGRIFPSVFIVSLIFARSLSESPSDFTLTVAPGEFI